MDVALDRTASAVEIRVRDTGEGMPPERLADLWSPHRAPRGSTLSRSGLGIGLTIVRTLVELHGGTVKADSAGPGQGATFSVTLPLTAEPPTQVTPPARPADAAGEGAGASRLEGTRVLLVDDAADTRELAGAILARSGAETEVVANAAAALDALDRARFDVLISDLAMPDRDGYDLIRMVRERAPERGGRIPAVALSAYARGEDRTQAIAAGYDRFLAKPVEPADLVSTVSALAVLRRSLARSHTRDVPPVVVEGGGPLDSPGGP